jgi:hypothetical protein
MMSIRRMVCRAWPVEHSQLLAGDFHRAHSSKGLTLERLLEVADQHAGHLPRFHEMAQHPPDLGHLVQLFEAPKPSERFTTSKSLVFDSDLGSAYIHMPVSNQSFPPRSFIFARLGERARLHLFFSNSLGKRHSHSIIHSLNTLCSRRCRTLVVSH